MFGDIYGLLISVVYRDVNAAFWATLLVVEILSWRETKLVETPSPAPA